MENKYFTPDIEEMFVGCEFEMDDTWGDWKKLILTEDLLKNPIVSLGSGNERAPWYWKIRVPYLTKEQIEAEGWKFDYNLADFDYYIKNNYELEFCYKQRININQGKTTLYHGECKDINTFRKIIKLLGI